MDPGRDNRSLSSLFTEVNRELSSLFRQEIALARAELSEKARQAGSGVGLLVAGWMVVLVGLFFVIQAAVFGLAAILVAIGVSDGIAVWLAPLLVAVVAVLIGWALTSKGIGTLRSTSATPSRTVESLRRDKELAEEHAR